MQTNLRYNARHDAYFNQVTDTWVEPQCADSKCEFCVGRPAKPSMVVDLKVPEGNWHQ